MPHTGNRSVCINAVTMALIDAGIPMKDFVCSCTVSLISDTPLVGNVLVMECILLGDIIIIDHVMVM